VYVWRINRKTLTYDLSVVHKTFTVVNLYFYEVHSLSIYFSVYSNISNHRLNDEYSISTLAQISQKLVYYTTQTVHTKHNLLD